MFRGNVLRGLLLLARGNIAGIAEFGDSNDALLASLAPLIAFPLVLSVLAGLQGQWQAAVIAFLSQISAFLAVSVLTQGFAAWARQEALWVRTATALNWSFWFMIALILVADVVRAMLVQIGVPPNAAFEIMMAVLGIYLFWYHWFTVRGGLRVKPFAAAGIVMATNMIVGLLSVGPVLIDHLIAAS